MEASTSKPRRSAAFNLTELLVVVAIIALLTALLLPALATAVGRARRIACQNKLRQVGLICLMYAQEDSRDRFPSAFQYGSRSWKQLQLSTPTLYGAEQLDLLGQEIKTWICPDRRALTLSLDAGLLNPDLAENCTHPDDVRILNPVDIGYQFFGGIRIWRNDLGEFEARSPISTASSQPGWALAADASLEVDIPGMDEIEQVMKNIPPHKSARGASTPDGGNQVFADGSVQWIPRHRMQFIHSWRADSKVRGYWWQEDLGDYGRSLAAVNPGD